MVRKRCGAVPALTTVMIPEAECSVPAAMELPLELVEYMCTDQANWEEP